MVLVVNDQQPYKTLKELVDDAKKRPDEIIFSSSGLYGALHLPTALFMKAAGIQMRHLPTNGGGPALTALLGNNAQVLVVVDRRRQRADQGRQAARAGLLRATSARPSLPDVPTLKELGYDVEFSLWVGLFAPKGTPDADRSTSCATDTKKAAATEQFRQAIDNIGDERRLSRPAGVRQVLGRGRQARRGRGAADRQGARMTARSAIERAGRRMILRRTMSPAARSSSLGVAGVRARAAICRSARLSSPGAGMMPKSCSALMIAVRRRCWSARAARASRSPRSTGATARTPLLVVAITAAAIALYQRSASSLTHVAAGVRAAGRGRAPKPLLRAAAYSVGADADRLLAVRHMLLKSPLERGIRSGF